MRTDLTARIDFQRCDNFSYDMGDVAVSRAAVGDLAHRRVVVVDADNPRP